MKRLCARSPAIYTPGGCNRFCFWIFPQQRHFALGTGGSFFRGPARRVGGGQPGDRGVRRVQHVHGLHGNPTLPPLRLWSSAPPLPCLFKRCQPMEGLRENILGSRAKLRMTACADNVGGQLPPRGVSHAPTTITASHGMKVSLVIFESIFWHITELGRGRQGGARYASKLLFW